MNIFGSPTSKGRNSRTVALIFYYNPILESSAHALQVQIGASAHLSHFRTSSGHSKTSDGVFEVLEPKLAPKICNKSAISPLILMIWHWNFTGWLIWLRWTSTTKIRTFWEQMIDLLSSKPHQTTASAIILATEKEIFLVDARLLLHPGCSYIRHPG